MTQDLRCQAKLHGVMLEDDVVEFGCTSRFCGAGKGIVVRHRFRISTGELISTHHYRSPERITDAPSGTNTSVRPA